VPTNFTYTALILSQSQNVFDSCEEISKSIDIKFSKASNMMDALEYLMDFKIDIILLDLSIGKEESIEFLQHISGDYENKATPIIALADLEKSQDMSNELSSFNIISFMCNTHWNIQASKLLNFLKITKLNLHVIQDSLVKSEDRGTMDQLTGAYNRYGCEDIFNTLTSRVKAYSEPFSIIMLDIDHFKSVNDTYGHDIGDEVLIGFSNIIMNLIRQNDSLVRLGGEEFIIFLSNANSNIAIKSAEKIRLKIEELMHSSQNLKITASFGVVEYRSNEDMDTLFKRADDLLYQAKDSGRNIVLSEKN